MRKSMLEKMGKKALRRPASFVVSALILLFLGLPAMSWAGSFSGAIMVSYPNQNVFGLDYSDPNVNVQGVVTIDTTILTPGMCAGPEAFELNMTVTTGTGSYYVNSNNSSQVPQICTWDMYRFDMYNIEIPDVIPGISWMVDIMGMTNTPCVFDPANPGAWCGDVNINWYESPEIWGYAQFALSNTSGGGAGGQTIYTTAGFNSIAAVDPATGAGTEILYTGNDNSGLAFDVDGTMYTINQSTPDGNGQRQLAQIDLNSGMITPVGAPITFQDEFGIQLPQPGMGMPAIEIDNFGQIYIGDFDGNFYTLDRSGIATRIGPGFNSVPWVMDYAFDTAGTLWATSYNQLYHIDLTNGNAIHVLDLEGLVNPPGGGFDEIMGIMFDSNNNLFATDMGWGDYSGTSNLYLVDIYGPALHLIGSTGLMPSHGGDINMASGPGPGCMDDSDGDGVCDNADICPGGNDTVDSDGDGTPDDCDFCPFDPADDADGDGVCGDVDVCEGGDDNFDSDFDGVPNDCDDCPNDSSNLCQLCRQEVKKVWYRDDGSVLRTDYGCNTPEAGIGPYCSSVYEDSCTGFRCLTGDVITPSCYSQSACEAACGGRCLRIYYVKNDYCAGYDNDGDGITDTNETACGSDTLNSASTCEVCDGIDNDLDGTVDEGVGSDSDGDGVCDAVDTCPNDADNDADNDGVCGDVDICPGGDDTVDADSDTIPDFCDSCPNDADNDADNDGVCGDVDICPGGDDTVDADSDTIPDFCDTCPNDADNDADNDGLCGDVDACPAENSLGFDVDNDGCIDSSVGLKSMLSILLVEGVIDATLENSLISKVEGAEKSMDKENVCAAVNKLEALVNEINAQRGKKISDDAANDVIFYTLSVKSYILSLLPDGEVCT